MFLGSGPKVRMWCNTRPPVSIPLAEMMIIGPRLASSSRESVAVRTPIAAWPGGSAGLGIEPMLTAMAAEELGDVHGHGAVQEHGDIRDGACSLELLHVVEERLRPPDGKRRDDHDTASGRGARDDLCELLAGVGRVVETVAVRGLDDDVVGRADLRRPHHDRISTLDGLAYWPGTAETFVSEVGTTMETELRRYRTVIHLRTPSKERGYNHRNPLRIESAGEAARLDEKVVAAWSGHPRRFFVDSADDFLDKMARVIALIRNEVPPCCRAHVVPEVAGRGTVS